MKTFALIAIIFSGQAGDAYSIAENMDAATCIEVMADVAADGGWFDGDESSWTQRFSLKPGDILSCEMIIEERG